MVVFFEKKFKKEDNAFKEEMIFHVSVQSDNFSYKYSRDGTCISSSDTLLQNTCTKFSYHTPSNASCASISVFLLFIAHMNVKYY